MSYLTDSLIPRMRQMADFLERNADALAGANLQYGANASTYFYDDEIVNVDGNSVKRSAKQQIASTFRAIRHDPAIKEVKKEYSSDTFYMRVYLTSGAYVQLMADRKTVCTRKVVGTETVEEKDYSKAPTITVTREIVEWECDPILDVNE